MPPDADAAAAVPSAERAKSVCAHCGSPVPAGVSSTYCCAGCEAVAQLLRDQGLTRYYALAPDTLPPVGAAPAARSHAWLEPQLEGARRRGGELAALELDVQGIHCAACVWLMNETFRRRDGAAQITVNPALGKVRLLYHPDRFDADAWVNDVERFGYRFGPSRKGESRARSSLTLRLGLCVALTMNVMLFSVSFYFGLSRADGPLYPLFTWLSAALSTAVVVIGGGTFIRAAVAGLRRRVLHLDLPIALGIVLVYATSLLQLRRGAGGELTYFDTLNTFITLMLLGRWLQERVLERNRRYLLDDDGAEGVFVRRIEDGRPTAAPASSVRQDDRLLVAPGELVPVDAALEGAPAAVSTDWITGEPEPRAVAAGGLIPAGSFNASKSAFVARARTDFQDSPLRLLLRQASPRDDRGRHRHFWHRLVQRWVIQVLSVAALGVAIWLPTAGPGKALDVAVALLVVTCPCAIGIALPLAYELTQARLRRAGFFVRAPDLLDRLERVRTLLFDKTGTLTLGRLALADEASVAALPADVREVAYNLACRSGHPIAACLAATLARTGARFDPDAAVTEVTGKGLVAVRPEGTWKLGRAAWATDGAVDTTDTLLSFEGRRVAGFRFREVLRAGASAELATLRRDGYTVHLLSGDAPARVARLASELGVPAEHARGGLLPSDKAAEVARLDHEDTLYLGDGINDSLAFERAHCAGTVAIERPVLPGKSDFFLVGEGLEPLGRALREARRLRAVARRVLRLSLSYNVLAVSTCLLGVMSPVRAAISMPLSSLGILLFTLWSLSERREQAPSVALREVHA